jgi:hypothetical protein
VSIIVLIVQHHPLPIPAYSPFQLVNQPSPSRQITSLVPPYSIDDNAVQNRGVNRRHRRLVPSCPHIPISPFQLTLCCPLMVRLLLFPYILVVTASSIIKNCLVIPGKYFNSTPPSSSSMVSRALTTTSTVPTTHPCPICIVSLMTWVKICLPTAFFEPAAMFFQFAHIPAYPLLDLARYLTDPFDIRSLGPLWTSSPDAEPIYSI